MHNIIIVSRMEVWPVERLIPYAANARTHSRKQVWQIARSMREHGVINPVLVDQHGNVIAGHGRILAAQFLGLPQLPVIILSHLSDAQVRALRIADNKIAENARWDEQKLHAELACLVEEKIDLTSLGFDDRELQRALRKLESQIGLVDENTAPEPPQQAVTMLGDLWNLGQQCILCADSTVPSNLVTVLENCSADMIYADLPYNIDYSGSPRGRARRPILNDNLGSDFGKFLYDSCVAMLAVAGGAIYISMSSSELHTLHKAFTEAGGHWSTYLIWVKDAFTLGRSPYQRQYEPMLFGWKEGGAHYFCGQRNLGDVWFIDKPRVNDLHPTMKPVELIERAILHSSKSGDLVLDPFAGSGSTLIACQKTSRRGRLIELDPRYVDVAILRWQAFSGQQATLAATGQSFECGLEILSAHPRLYWNDHCTPGSEWLKFTKKCRPTDRLWTASDEETSFPPMIALPSRENLGLGRHWHFLADFGWLLTGLLYIIMLLTSPEWQRLIPGSWHILPDAGRALLGYLTLHIVEVPGRYNGLQQLSYAAVVFLLAPFSIATGIAMSPAVAARFPWYIKIFHGRQAARSRHFLALCMFLLFFIGHVALVVLHGFRKGLAMIVLGETHNPHLTRGLVVWLSGLAGIVIIHVMTTICSHRRPRFVQNATQAITDPLRTLLFGHEIFAQHYTRADISPYFWVNGRAPAEEAYLAMACDRFANYTLEAGGLVEKPLRLTLADLRAMPKQTQVTKHCCIQGWSGVAEWSGVSLSHIVALCRPFPAARYIVFYAFDNKSTSEPHAQGPGYFYGTIRRELADDPQTILAYEMNGEPLPVDHGAPLRLRVETQLGFTMVKYIRAIEFVADYAHIGQGQGGWREDYQYFSQEAGI